MGFLGENPCIFPSIRETRIETGSTSTASATTQSFELGNFPLCAKGPELAGCVVGAVVSGENQSGVEEISAELSLALKSGCPARETAGRQGRVRITTITC
jgi:hypothetical protein